MSSKPPPDAELAPGVVLGGKFRVERVVGRGGMGVVIEATNVQLDQRVALKLLATNANDPSSVDRFNSEARAAARLRSEHVARVYDVGKDTLHGPYIVMELLEGKTLADVIKTSGRVPIHRAVEYVIDACEGLAEAHSRGIVHQDVKPANLFLVTGPDGRPSVKLLDFGIATMRSKEREADAKSSHPKVGTPAYLAPEQLKNTGYITHRADIWALGCVLYELLVADRAFRAKRFTELVTKILESQFEPIPADLVLPPPLKAAILRCLERDPEKRFTSTADLALTIAPFARERAQLSVSRAIDHVTKSGLDPNLKMPSQMPSSEAPPSSPVVDFPNREQLLAPAVPRFSSGAIGPLARSKRPSEAQPPRRGMAGPLAAIALLAVVAVVVWMKVRTAGTDVSLVAGHGDVSAAPSAKGAAAPPESKLGEPAVAPSPTTTHLPTDAGGETAPAKSAASAKPIAPVTVAPRPVAHPSAKPKAPGGESDIRFER